MLPTFGTHITIERDRKEPKSGQARMLDQDDKEIYLDLPLASKERRVMVLEPGEKISISYQLQDGSVYFFETQVIRNKLTIDNLPAISIAIPSQDQITKIQRRQFLRVPVRIELAYLCLLKHRTPNELKSGQGYTWDLSGGGLAFYSNVDYILPNDLLTMKFFLPGESRVGTPIKVRGEVVRLYESAETNLTITSVRFTEISRAQEQRIIRYVFQRQIELKNKGVESYR